VARNKFDFDLIVIGSGAGGSSAATIAARDGKRVAIVETDTFGGTSPNWGDIPTKSLLHAAHLYDDVKSGGAFGLRASALGYNFLSIQAWKSNVLKKIGAGDSKRNFEADGVTTLHGQAHFLSPHEITVNRQTYSAENFLIATGAHQAIPDITGIGDIELTTYRSLLEAPRPPKSLFIIGGGHIALEISELFAIFGTKVYIAEVAPHLLPAYDSEVGELIGPYFEKHKSMTVLTKTKVVAVEKENIAKRVIFNRGGQEHNVRVDEVLVAAGRLPNVDIGLDNAGVDYTAKGIKTNEFLQTTARHIYAAGDVLGHNGYTHTAMLESRVAVNNILSRHKYIPEYEATPRVIFTNPSIASVGLTEDDCIRRDLQVRKATAPLSIIMRSNTSNFSDGFVKLITDKKGVLIGATIVAPHAGEMIHELALAIKYNLTATQVASTPHAFLTWSEAIKAAANKLS
jgi:dihydrolipoamide dehydrogenase